MPTNSQFKLFLREMIESELKKGSIRDALKQALPIVKHLVPRGGDVDDALDEFIDDNSEEWNNLLSTGPIKYLGSGRQGSAFSLGDLILKLQPGVPRTAEIQSSLYAGESGAGDLPNVVDVGTMDSVSGPIGWSLVEKFSEVGELSTDPDWAELWRQVSMGIEAAVKAANRDPKGRVIKDPDEQASFLTIPTDDLAEDLTQRVDGQLMKDVSERYRLSSEWFVKFLDMLKSNYVRGMVDFKPDNMGIRRRGAEGDVVLFDAASAKKRDIKKWEPH